jgi:hypothetical protein
VTIPEQTVPLEAMKLKLGFLYVAREELSEAIRYAGSVRKRARAIDGGEHASLEAKAMDIAAIITYARPFKRSYGFDQVTNILHQSITELDAEQMQVHERVIRLRDQEFAHMDAEPLDVRVHFDNMFEFSKAVTREPLDAPFLNGIIATARIHIGFIESQIGILRRQYRDAGGDLEEFQNYTN